MYGGIVTENIVMGLERQLLVGAMFKAERAGWRPIFNGYDALVCEPPASLAPEKFGALTCTAG